MVAGVISLGGEWSRRSMVGDDSSRGEKSGGERSDPFESIALTPYSPFYLPWRRRDWKAGSTQSDLSPLQWRKILGSYHGLVMLESGILFRGWNVLTTRRITKLLTIRVGTGSFYSRSQANKSFSRGKFSIFKP